MVALVVYVDVRVRETRVSDTDYRAVCRCVDADDSRLAAWGDGNPI